MLILGPNQSQRVPRRPGFLGLAMTETGPEVMWLFWAG